MSVAVRQAVLGAEESRRNRIAPSGTFQLAPKEGPRTRGQGLPDGCLSVTEGALGKGPQTRGGSRLFPRCVWRAPPRPGSQQGREEHTRDVTPRGTGRGPGTGRIC